MDCIITSIEINTLILGLLTLHLHEVHRLLETISVITDIKLDPTLITIVTRKHSNPPSAMQKILKVSPDPITSQPTRPTHDSIFAVENPAPLLTFCTSYYSTCSDMRNILTQFIGVD